MSNGKHSLTAVAAHYHQTLLWRSHILVDVGASQLIAFVMLKRNR
jgi:hypothetical protein